MTPERPSKVVTKSKKIYVTEGEIDYTNDLDNCYITVVICIKIYMKAKWVQLLGAPTLI